MIKEGKIVVGISQENKDIELSPKMVNRHGLITGATGTGKTTTLKMLTEDFSSLGVPVFFSDVKGDLGGLMKEFPVTFWDVFQKSGIPLRTTISEMGPVLLSKLLSLNETQEDVLNVVFKIADDEGILLIDTKDLKAMLNYAAENSKNYAMKYGNIPSQTVTTIVRGIVALEAEGAENFFFEPALDIKDWFIGDISGKGMLNILDCRNLVKDSKMYSCFLIWMFSELFEVLPEVGDLDKPRMVFFFDEAHLIFKDMNKKLTEKFVQVVKLIRSKGVGVYFISQTPSDIPDEILSQLGNKIQHGLRAYTPNDEKIVKAVSDSLRSNPNFDTYDTLLNLGTGEALISLLGDDGVPGIVEKCKICAPKTMDINVTEEEKMELIKKSNLYLKYMDSVDRESAYEFLNRMEKKEYNEPVNEPMSQENKRERASLSKEQKSAIKKVGNSAVGTIGREVGKAIGSNFGTFGKRLGGNVGAELARSVLGTLLK